MAYIMDTNEEERAKGKTVEVCTGCISSMSHNLSMPEVPLLAGGHGGAFRMHLMRTQLKGWTGKVPCILKMLLAFLNPGPD